MHDNLIIGCAILVIARIFYFMEKLITLNVIINHPEWSDDKIKSITKMMSKDKPIIKFK